MAHAVNYTTWLENWLPSRAIPDYPPYELVLGSKPNLAQAHEFGARDLIHVLEGSKLIPRTGEAGFVGKDVESKGYWVYWLLKRRVSVQQNVPLVPSTVVVTDGVHAEGEYAVH
jgi:hypothetical protein